MGKKCKEIGIPVYINSGANQISGSNPNSGEIKILTDRINKMGSKLGFAIGELTQMRFQFGSLRSTRFGNVDTNALLKASVDALSKQIDELDAAIKKKMGEADAALSKANDELAAALAASTKAEEALNKATTSGTASNAVVTNLKTDLAAAEKAVSDANILVNQQTTRINDLATKLKGILGSSTPTPAASFGKK